MKNILLSILSLFIFQLALAQTLLTEAEDFHVKTIDGETILLFPILDEEEQIVVIDFFSTSCGPCQDFADDFQRSYEAFGYNTGNVYHMGINWGSDNQGVHDFDSVFGLTFPSVSGIQGGGNIVYNQYQIQSYPTVIVINNDHEISEQYVWEPSEENIEAAIIAAGGTLVGFHDQMLNDPQVSFFPNPVQNSLGSIHLELPEAAYFQFGVYDVLGRKIMAGSQNFIQSGNFTIPIEVNQLSNGFYFLELSIGEKEIEGIKFVVDR